MSAHIALMGFRVMLYNRTVANIEAIKELGGIQLGSFEGGARGFGELEMASSDIVDVVTNADVIMIVVPSSAHSEFAAKVAPHLHDDQLIVLHPGRTGGALACYKVVRE
jgi:opine dehydrogenase